MSNMNGWITHTHVGQTRYKQSADGDWTQGLSICLTITRPDGSTFQVWEQMSPEDARTFAYALIEQAVTSDLVNDRNTHALVAALSKKANDRG